MKKRRSRGLQILSCIFAAAGLAFMSSCGMGKQEVQLSVWSDEDNIPVIQEMVDSFKKEYSKEADFKITISAEGEPTCKDTVLANPEGAADLFAFADDQFEDMYRAGVLLDITDDTDAIIAENGTAAEAAMRDGGLWAYPVAEGNGAFLYYNKAYFNEDDIKSLDKMLDIAEQKGKKVSIDFESGWYLYSFFKGAGLTLRASDDGETNICNWNATDTHYKGADVANVLLGIASHRGFLSATDNVFVDGAKSGHIIAGINGAWNSEKIKEAYGENFGAAKLPEFKINGDNVQLASFVGYKLLGVNAYSKNPEWAMRLARWITNEQNQLLRFEKIGDCPSNINARKSEKVQSSEVVAAIAAQSKYGTMQSVEGNFWNPAYIFGTIIEMNNPDGTDVQTLLDTLVEGATAKQEK